MTASTRRPGARTCPVGVEIERAAVVGLGWDRGDMGTDSERVEQEAASGIELGFHT